MAKDENHPTVAEIIGRNARRLRGDRSQDDIASIARGYGLQWTQPVIASIEAGSRSLDLAEVSLLAASLTAGIPELLAGDETVRLSPMAISPLDELRSAFADPAVKRNRYLYSSPTADAVFEDGRLAEIRAADRLGVSVETVVATSKRLWGHTLTEERNARVAGRTEDGVSQASQQAYRGRVTRHLLTELRNAIEGTDR